MKFKAVFLDKDGTIIPDVPYNVDVSKISLSESVVEGLQLLQSGAYLLVVVSNQSGVAYGYFNTQEVASITVPTIPKAPLVRTKKNVTAENRSQACF